MPFQLDQEALDSPNLKILDINKPPTKSIGHQEYPKMVFLHPKDKTAEHRTRIVADEDELHEAQAKGWKSAPHVPEAKPDVELEEFEYEAPEPVRRGPGRPRNDAA